MSTNSINLTPHYNLLLRMLVLGLFVVFGGVSHAISQSKIVTDVVTSTEVKVFVPSSSPVQISEPMLVRAIDGDSHIRFVAKNASVRDLSNIRLMALVINKNGTIKAGQGWTSSNVLKRLASSENRFALKHSIENGDTIVLTVYEAKGDVTRFRVPPGEILKELGSAGIVKIKHVKQVIKVAESRLVDENPCAAAQTAAAQACRCGLKSFSCDPGTGAYSFTYFSPAENPECPPEN